MDGRQELLAYLTSATVTIVALFGLQYWYETYLDVAVVHAQRTDAPLNEKVVTVRAEEQRKLSSAPLPIDQAKRALAQRGRTGFPRVAPKPSDDLSAMAGWIYQPGFKPYEPRTPSAPASDQAGVSESGAAVAATEPAASARTPGVRP